MLDSVVPFEKAIPWIQAFDALESPTRLRFSSEVLSGTWEALYSGRADLLIGSRLDQNQFASATGLHIQSFGNSFVCVCRGTQPSLAEVEEPVCIDTIRQYRAVAVGDTSRNFKPLTFGCKADRPC